MHDGLKKLIQEKRAWAEPLDAAARAKGFLGWYASQNLPHFDHPGRQQFITYRLADSMPASLRREWQKSFPKPQGTFMQRKIEACLDAGHGQCHLTNPAIAQLVQDNLWYHDGTKYKLWAWVIMPNHVHALLEILDVPLGEILRSLKTFTARHANQLLKRSGSFWAEDYFDRFIRSEGHRNRVIRYMEQNPVKAFLAQQPEDWPWSSARYRTKADLSARTLVHPKGPAGRGPSVPFAE